MIRTHGLTHLSLTVADVDRAVRFYETVFGAKEYARGDGWAQVLGPGPHDVLAFEKGTPTQPEGEHVRHFGFRLVSPDDIDDAVRELESAGATLVARGDHGPGLPYAYVRDPDGYEIEVWFE